MHAVMRRVHVHSDPETTHTCAHLHASFAGRCQTLNAELAAEGIHVCHVIVDGAVDAPDTLGKMLGAEKFEALRATTGVCGRHAVTQTHCCG